MARSSKSSKKVARKLKITKKKAEEYSEEFKEKKESLEKFIKEHPLLSVGIAMWIGHILTKIFDRR